MADEDEELEEEAGDAPDPSDIGDDEDDEGAGPPKKGGRAKLFIIIGAVVVLLIGAGAGVYLLGYLDSLLGVEESLDEEDAVVQGEVFYKLEEIVLNLNQEGRKSRFLKIGLTLVLLHDSDVPSMELLTPRITDYVSTYLRELRPDEITGSANFVRIRENVLLRIRAAVAPIQVTNVLFNSVLVQ